ncbi:MAG: hypothetical protein HY046_14365 [Acidobacteria bacterium]|nr:hypothetical protein [Acidobacteriota bacterium]
MAPRATKTGPTKKTLILREASALGKQHYSPSDIEELQRRIFEHAGPAWKPSLSYVASVLEDAGFEVLTSARADTTGRFEREFHHLLHFSTFEETEKCLSHLLELLRQFQAASEKAAIERVFETARLGRTRAERIARNPKVDADKRVEKSEIAQWFKVWLDLPEAFEGWLELRKQSPEFVEKFGNMEQN